MKVASARAAAVKAVAVAAVAAAVASVHEGRASPPRPGAVDLLDLEGHIGR